MLPGKSTDGWGILLVFTRPPWSVVKTDGQGGVCINATATAFLKAKIKAKAHCIYVQ